MKVMLAETYNETTDPTGWWMSEKLDGVRAVWDGTRFLSRNGNELHAPEWFKQCLPNAILDGELYAGRGEFAQAVGTVKTKVPIDDEWQGIHYMVFDLPEHPGTLAERYLEMAKMEALQYVHGKRRMQIVHQILCTSRVHMKGFLDGILAQNGEGVMLRLPESRYIPERSPCMLKVKPVLSFEATVTEYLPGEGRNTGRVGALICDFRGIRIRVGTGLSDSDRNNPPAIGAAITFECQMLNPSGAPRFPRFIGVRNYE